jgi:hypothetical protein
MRLYRREGPLMQPHPAHSQRCQLLPQHQAHRVAHQQQAHVQQSQLPPRLQQHRQEAAQPHLDHDHCRHATASGFICRAKPQQRQPQQRAQPLPARSRSSAYPRRTQPQRAPRQVMPLRRLRRHRSRSTRQLHRPLDRQWPRARSLP